MKNTGSGYIIGIDEAGRGPLAGPVAVGVACVSSDFDWDLLPGVTDSKKLCESKREDIFVAARRLKAAGQLDYSVSLVSAKIIDQIGIVPSVNRGIERCLKRLEKSPSSRSHLELGECLVKLDGGLKAPERFRKQETIIKGDQKEKVIGLGSIMAKVTRDRYMQRLCKESPYTKYGFDKHKGYGTKVHKEAIEKYGLTDQHRRTFCRFYVEK